MTKILNVFSDGSVNPQTGVGCGAYLITTELNQPLSFYQTLIQCNIFNETSSTRLELQIVLWVFDLILAERDPNETIVFHTDSSNIINLMDRKARLQSRNFQSNKGKALRNADLYQRFFTLTEQYSCRFVKIKGHQPVNTKNSIEKLFTLVDRAARAGLRAIELDLPEK